MRCLLKSKSNQCFTCRTDIPPEFMQVNIKLVRVLQLLNPVYGKTEAPHKLPSTGIKKQWKQKPRNVKKIRIVIESLKNPSKIRKQTKKHSPSKARTQTKEHLLSKARTQTKEPSPSKARTQPNVRKQNKTNIASKVRTPRKALSPTVVIKLNKKRILNNATRPSKARRI